MAAASGQRNTRHGELKEMLLREIRNSGINTRLPSENELSRQFGVCRATVNKVMVELERERYIIRRRGKGTFVIPRDQKLENGNPLLGGGRIVSVYPDFFSYSDWEMTHRIELAALKNNCELVSLKLQPDSDLESLFELLEREERIAGAIIRIGFNLTGTLVKRLEAAGIPMVVLLPPPPESGGKLAFVYGDNRALGLSENGVPAASRPPPDRLRFRPAFAERGRAASGGGQAGAVRIQAELPRPEAFRTRIGNWSNR